VIHDVGHLAEFECCLFLLDDLSERLEDHLRDLIETYRTSRMTSNYLSGVFNWLQDFFSLFFIK
jgi:hypothetical protein